MIQTPLHICNNQLNTGTKGRIYQYIEVVVRRFLWGLYVHMRYHNGVIMSLGKGVLYFTLRKQRINTKI